MWGVPGSHLIGPNVKHRKAYDSTIGAVINVPYVISDKPYSKEGGIPLEVKAGSILLFKGNFLHWSDKNTSD